MRRERPVENVIIVRDDQHKILRGGKLYKKKISGLDVRDFVLSGKKGNEFISAFTSIKGLYYFDDDYPRMKEAYEDNFRFTLYYFPVVHLPVSNPLIAFSFRDIKLSDELHSVKVSNSALVHDLTLASPSFGHDLRKVGNYFDWKGDFVIFDVHFIEYKRMDTSYVFNNVNEFPVEHLSSFLQRRTSRNTNKRKRSRSKRNRKRSKRY